MKRGGARMGAGRKKVEDLKIQLCLYIPQSLIDKLGGMQATRDYLYDKLKVFKK